MAFSGKGFTDAGRFAGLVERVKEQGGNLDVLVDVLFPDGRIECCWTPLHLAAVNSESSKASSLLIQGANPNARTGSGWKPCDLAAGKWRDKSVHRSLCPGAETSIPLTPTPDFVSPPTQAQPTSGPTASNLAWVKDGITFSEMMALDGLQHLERELPALAKIVLAYPWVTDGMDIIPPGTNGSEREAREFMMLHEFTYFSKEDPQLFRSIVAMPWLADGVSGEEIDAIVHLMLIYNSEKNRTGRSSITDRITSFKWFSDGITSNEAGVIYSVSEVSRNHLTTAETIINSPFFAGDITDLHRDFPTNLLRFLDQYGEGPLARLPWYQDGFTRDEAALLMVLSFNATRNPAIGGRDPEPEDLIKPEDPLFQVLVQGNGLRSQTLSLPSGDVNLYIVRHPSIRHEDELVFRLLRNVVEEMDGIMGPPWVQKDLVVYRHSTTSQDGVISLGGGNRAGKNHGSHFYMSADPEDSYFKRTVYHEAAHFYTGFLPRWLDEGFAEYTASYVLNARDNVSLESSNQYAERRMINCIPNGWSTIQKLIDLGPGFLGYLGCDYGYPHFFALKLHFELGGETVSSTFRDLYRTKNAVLSKAEPAIYRAFLSNTPPDKKDLFRELYQQYHGGPIPDP